MRNNSVFQTLVIPAGKPIEAGKTIGDLKPGQAGVFDATTNLSIDAEKGASKFILVVAHGVGTTVTGHSVSVNPGEGIEPRLVKYLDTATYKPSKKMKVQLTDVVAQAGTTYSIKVRIENAQTLSRQGLVPFTHTFTVTTPEADMCAEISCPSFDENKLLAMFYKTITSNDFDFIKVRAFDDAKKELADIDAIDKYVEAQVQAAIADPATKKKMYLEFEALDIVVPDFGAVPTRYFNNKESKIYVSLDSDLGSGYGKVKVAQNVQFEQGSYLQVKYREYLASSNNGQPGPYKVSELLGLAFDGFAPQAKSDKTYTVVNMLFHNISQGGWLTYENDMRLELACEDADTAKEFTDILENVFKQANVVVPVTKS